MRSISPELQLIETLVEARKQKLPRPNKKGQIRLRLDPTTARWLMGEVGGRFYTGVWTLSRKDCVRIGYPERKTWIRTN